MAKIFVAFNHCNYLCISKQLFFRSEGFYLPPFSLNLLNISQQRVAFLIAVRSQDQLSWETPPPASLDQLQHGRLQPYLSAYLVIPVSYHDKCCSFR